MRAINTVCLCGSTRYLEDFTAANVELTKRGLSVITISMALVGEQQKEQAALKELLDLVHFNKILRADAVVVVGAGYVGFSTAREILWADMQGKPIYPQTNYTSDDGTDWLTMAIDITEGDNMGNADMASQADEVLREKAPAEAM